VETEDNAVFPPQMQSGELRAVMELLVRRPHGCLYSVMARFIRDSKRNGSSEVLLVGSIAHAGPKGPVCSIPIE
jgi:hypothetical protein